MAKAVTYGKTFTKNGKKVCYRYVYGKKDALVSASVKTRLKYKKPFRGRSRARTSRRYTKR